MAKRLRWILGLVALIGSVRWLLVDGDSAPAKLPQANGQPGTELITGASSGIGAAYARQLAAQGYNLVLTARRREKLAALATQLEQQHGVVVELLPADLADIDEIERVAQRITEIDDLTLLINNAGFGTDGPLAESTPASQVAMLNVHNRAPMRLVQAALPAMVARGQQGSDGNNHFSAAVINVSSIAAFAVLPNSVNYAATKAFLNSFSRSLQPQVARYGIAVQALCPGFTRTEFHDTEAFAHFNHNHLPSLFWMSADDVARQSLAALGGRVVFVPGLLNRLIAAGLGPISSNPLLQQVQRKIVHR